MENESTKVDTIDIIARIIELNHGDKQSPYFVKAGASIYGDLKSRLGRLSREMQLPKLAFDYFAEEDFTDFSSRKYSFLFIENRFIDLYLYLHTDEFWNFQTTQLQQYRGIFAYVDVENQILRYLASTQDLPKDTDKAKPHFFLPLNFYNGKKHRWEKETPYFFEDSMKIFYHVLNNSNINRIDFVNILRGRAPYDQKQTTFEKEHNILYNPSGEIDTCIVCWFFLQLEEPYRKRLITVLTDESEDGKDPIEQLDTINLALNWDFIKDNILKIRRNIRLFVPYIGRSYTIFEWLYFLGLTQGKEGDERFLVTERGSRLLSWTALYLRAIYEKDQGKKTPLTELAGLIELIKDNKPTSNLWLRPSNIDEQYLQAHGWSKAEYEQLFYSLADHLDEANQAGQNAKPVHLKKAWLGLLKLLLFWNERTSDRELRLRYFQDRCRFELIPNFTLRSRFRQEEVQTDNLSRARFAFPVLIDDYQEKKTSTPSEIVGFFLGAIRDATADGKGYLEGLLNQDETIITEFRRVVKLNKAVMEILARVENREIYYKDVKKQIEQYRLYTENERKHAHANKYLYRSMSDLFNKLTDEIHLQKLSILKSRPALIKITELLALRFALMERSIHFREIANSDIIDAEPKYCTIDLVTFLKFLFIDNFFLTDKSNARLRFLEIDLPSLKRLLELTEFRLINNYKAMINEVFRLFFDGYLEIDVDQPYQIRLPDAGFEKAKVDYYVAFSELIQNYRKSIGDWYHGIKNIYHVRYVYSDLKLFIFQSIEGDPDYKPFLFKSFETPYRFISMKKRVNDKMIVVHPPNWTDLRRDGGIGLNIIKKFFRERFNSVYRLRNIKIENTNTIAKEKAIVYHEFTNINHQLIS